MNKNVVVTATILLGSAIMLTTPAGAQANKYVVSKNPVMTVTPQNLQANKNLVASGGGNLISNKNLVASGGGNLQKLKPR